MEFDKLVTLLYNTAYSCYQNGSNQLEVVYHIIHLLFSINDMVSPEIRIVQVAELFGLPVLAQWNGKYIILYGMFPFTIDSSDISLEYTNNTALMSELNKNIATFPRRPYVGQTYTEIETITTILVVAEVAFKQIVNLVYKRNLESLITPFNYFIADVKSDVGMGNLVVPVLGHILPVQYE